MHIHTGIKQSINYSDRRCKYIIYGCILEMKIYQYYVEFYFISNEHIVNNNMNRLRHLQYYIIINRFIHVNRNYIRHGKVHMEK